MFTGLSRALSGVFATAAFDLVSSDIWGTHCVRPLPDAVGTLLSIRTLVPPPGQSDAWAWQGNTGRLIEPDMRMRPRGSVGQAGWEAQRAGSHPGARSRRLPS
ncbi:hypothetical protein DMH25_05150 [Streptomyces sp. WAC 01325]|nr:hypothetical protein DMH25_05150 [Streptomyces sp. WAC 01325]